MEITTTQIALLGAMLTAVVALLGGFNWVVGLVNNCRTVLETKLTAVQTEGNLALTAAMTSEEKQRHSLANTTQVSMDRLGRDVETLKKEAVRKEDMTSLDVRMEARFNKFEARLDRMGEQLGELNTVKVLVTQNGELLAKMLIRLEGKLQ